jgi:hypothetical protein
VENYHVSNQSRHGGTCKLEKRSSNGISVRPTSAQKEAARGKKASLGEARRTTVHQADHTGMNTAKRLTPAKKDFANQSIEGEK